MPTDRYSFSLYFVVHAILVKSWSIDNKHKCGARPPSISCRPSSPVGKKCNHRRDSNPQSPANSVRLLDFVTHRRRRPMPYPLGHGGAWFVTRRTSALFWVDLDRPRAVSDGPGSLYTTRLQVGYEATQLNRVELIQRLARIFNQECLLSFLQIYLDVNHG